jgi:hypothetical protein
MIIAGIVAIASLTINTTMEPNGILMLVTTTSLSGFDIVIISWLVEIYAKVIFQFHRIMPFQSIGCKKQDLAEQASFSLKGAQIE